MRKIILIIVFLSGFKIQSQIINTIAGNGTLGYAGDGAAAVNAELNFPSGVITDGLGNIYISDKNNHRIRKVNTSGIITTIAGTGITGYSGDGGISTLAEIKNPNGITIDSFGNIYFADTGNHCIRKINTSGIISTIAGCGIQGYGGDGGAATLAYLNFPAGVAIDGTGNIFITDSYNYYIRKINTSGIISTIAGTGLAGFSGDGGPAIISDVNYPLGITVDGAGNLFFADEFNQRIRKINTSGIITTVAGSVGTPGFGGDGGVASSAQLAMPWDVRIDGAGNLYISDTYNQRIRMVNSLGIINTIAGNGTFGFSGDGGLATNAQINNPFGVALDLFGNLYIADGDNHRVRRTSLVTTLNEINVSKEINVYPNPCNGILTVNLSDNKIHQIKINDILFRDLYSQTIDASQQKEYIQINISDFSDGVYYLQFVNNDKSTVIKKIVKQ